MAGVSTALAGRGAVRLQSKPSLTPENSPLPDVVLSFSRFGVPELVDGCRGG